MKKNIYSWGKNLVLKSKNTKTRQLFLVTCFEIALAPVYKIMFIWLNNSLKWDIGLQLYYFE